MYAESKSATISEICGQNSTSIICDGPQASSLAWKCLNHNGAE